MSVAQPQTPPPASASNSRQITIVSHSTLFYWWPVWALGLLLGFLSLVSGQRMAVVPDKTGVRYFEVPVIGKDGKENMEKREILVLPENKHVPRVDPNDPNSDPLPFRQVSSGRSFGVLFATILLLVIVITNVPLRGMWSFMVIFLIVALSIIFALAGWWDIILRYFGYLDIRINAGGYIFISTILFAIWLFTVLVFDKQIYMVFTPGQFKVCTEAGGGEQTYSTLGMTLEKQRSDLFRHWILGLGSGDLIVKTTGAQAHHFEMSNVLFIGRKMQQIEDMVRKIPD
ncbi:MAG TPA: hypothetical protein VMG10_33350 [Gemmataceae bacterium]|nr:hypothetical protein [Gemmataceae bacterium]